MEYFLILQGTCYESLSEEKPEYMGLLRVIPLLEKENDTEILIN